VEVHAIEQIPHGAQLFVFDSNSPPPSKGTIPKVQFVVTAAQVMKYRRSMSNPQTPAIVQVIETSQSRSSLNEYHKPQASADDGNAAFAKRQEQPSPVALPGAQHRPLSSEARNFLFMQLCRASGEAQQISAQKLHSLLIENGMVFPTEVFSDMLAGRLTLSREHWDQFEADFPPVVETLYQRLYEKSNASRDVSALLGLKARLQALEDEENQLLVRHAKLREEIAKVSRSIREEENKRSQEVNTGERDKSWTMVQKFVSLKLRQMKLRNEEAQIDHQLQLL
jgi:hypothetical protein